jgi:hypothetical protein
MQTHLIDTQNLKTVLLELIQSDNNFMQQLKNLLLPEMPQNKPVMVENADLLPILKEKNLYQKRLSPERKRKQNALKKRYEQSYLMDINVIAELQHEFSDAPSADEMIQLLDK